TWRPRLPSSGYWREHRRTLTGSHTRSRKCRGMSRVVRSGRALPSNRGGGDVREVREALDVLRSQPAIALLFTDVVMPGPLDGFSLAHEAKKMHPDLRVVYASGYIKNLPWGEHGIGHGRILSKPFRPIKSSRRSLKRCGRPRATAFSR